MENKLMLSVLTNDGIDNPQSIEETYFDKLDDARLKGMELIKRYNANAFRVIKLTTGRGHFRTIGFFNANNEYIR